MTEKSDHSIINQADHYYRSGDLIAAESLCQSVLAVQPDNLEALFMAGTIAFQQSRLDEALKLFKHAALQAPTIAAIHNNIGTTLKLLKRPEEATAVFRRAVELQPDYAVAWFNLGSIELENGHTDKAEEAFRRCLEHDPDHAEACNKLGEILADKSDYLEALSFLKKSEALYPDSPILCNNLGNLLKFMGRAEDAVNYYNKATNILGDDPSPFSNKLLCMLCATLRTPEEVFIEHRKWGECFADEFLNSIPKHGNDRSPDRPLRIGYVSRDFRAHPVAFFIQPILASHDHSRVSVHAYLDLPEPDAITG